MLCTQQRPPSRHSSASSRTTPVADAASPPRQPSHSGDGQRTGRRAGRKARTGRRLKAKRKSSKQSDSDSETNASYQSDGSRVSFDPTPSDTEQGSLDRAMLNVLAGSEVCCEAG